MVMMMMMKDEYSGVFLQKSFGFYWHMSHLRILLCIMIKDEITCSTSGWSCHVLRDQVGHRSADRSESSGGPSSRRHGRPQSTSN